MWETWQNHDFNTEIIEMALLEVKLAARTLAKSLFPLIAAIYGTININRFRVIVDLKFMYQSDAA